MADPQCETEELDPHLREALARADEAKGHLAEAHRAGAEMQAAGKGFVEALRAQAALEARMWQTVLNRTRTSTAPTTKLRRARKKVMMAAYRALVGQLQGMTPKPQQGDVLAAFNKALAATGHVSIGLKKLRELADFAPDLPKPWGPQGRPREA